MSDSARYSVKPGRYGTGWDVISDAPKVENKFRRISLPGICHTDTKEQGQHIADALNLMPVLIAMMQHHVAVGLSIGDLDRLALELIEGGYLEG